METIFEQGKQFEYLVTTFDPVFNSLLISIDIVKKFIIDNNLIIYGGTSLDYALRLCGDSIYPDNMLAVPDLDCYSPINVEHAYQLADILYHHGYTNARAINAQHMKTMRVDLIDNHFIADITYIPQEIFSTLPYLIYNGMKIIHPHFLRIDLHSSLSFPYDNPPNEVIFERWDKDIKRFNKLAAKYPLISNGDGLILNRLSIPIDINKYVLTGFAAYSAIYYYYITNAPNFGIVPDNNIIKSLPDIKNNLFTFLTIDQKIHLVGFDIDSIAAELNIIGDKYDPYINIIPEKIIGTWKHGQIELYSTTNKLVGISTVVIDGINFKITNIQYLLKTFLSMYFINRDNKIVANTYINHYNSLLSMIKSFDDVLSKEYTNSITDSPLYPSITIYGNNNYNLSAMVGLNRLFHDVDNTTLYITPSNYYPEKSLKNNNPHPSFDYQSSVFFHESGNKIDNIN